MKYQIPQFYANLTSPLVYFGLNECCACRKCLTLFPPSPTQYYWNPANYFFLLIRERYFCVQHWYKIQQLTFCILVSQNLGPDITRDRDGYYEKVCKDNELRGEMEKFTNGWRKCGKILF